MKGVVIEESERRCGNLSKLGACYETIYRARLADGRTTPWQSQFDETVYDIQDAIGRAVGRSEALKFPRVKVKA